MLKSGLDRVRVLEGYQGLGRFISHVVGVLAT